MCIIFLEKLNVSMFSLLCRREACNEGEGDPPLYVNVNMFNGQLMNTWIDSLQAFFPGLQVISILSLLWLDSTVGWCQRCSFQCRFWVASESRLGVPTSSHWVWFLAPRRTRISAGKNLLETALLMLQLLFSRINSEFSYAFNHAILELS